MNVSKNPARHHCTIHAFKPSCMRQYYENWHNLPFRSYCVWRRLLQSEEAAFLTTGIFRTAAVQNEGNNIIIPIPNDITAVSNH